MFDCKHPRGNTLITQNFDILSDYIITQLSGCICAYVVNNYIFAAIHKNGKTILARGEQCESTYGRVYINYKFKILSVEDDLVDIINIFEYVSYRGNIVILSTSEGVHEVFNFMGEKVKLPNTIPVDTVNVIVDHAINYEGKVTNMSLVEDDINTIDSNGVLRDIRTALDKYPRFNIVFRYWFKAKISPEMLYSDEPSLYEQGINAEDCDIDEFHGMRVFTPLKMVKSARKR